jgi:hypothetical protein
MERYVKKYLKTEYSKGASPFARMLDVFGLRMVVFMAGYFAYLLVTRSLIVSLILAGITTFAASLALSRMERARFEKFARKFLEGMRETAMLEELVILPRAQRMKFFGEVVRRQPGFKEAAVKKDVILGKDRFARIFDRHPAVELTEQDILNCLRIAQREGVHQCLLVGAAKISDAAKIFASGMDGYAFELLDKEEILSFARQGGVLPSEERIEEKIANMVAQKKLNLKKLKAEVFGGGKFKTYVVTAVVMAGLSVALRFQPYFLSMAAFCGFLAVMTYYYNPPKKA